VRFAVIWLALLTTLGCSRRSGLDGQDDLLVFAAASLHDALSGIGRDFEQETPRAQVRFSFAGSNALAQQLIAAPRADVYFSASEAWMNRVEQAGTIEPGSRRALLGNQLVLVVRRDAPLTVSDVCDLLTADLDHVALGDPAAVPAGIYAREYLEGKNCGDRGSAWETLRHKTIPTPDVRAALAQAEASLRVAAFVYRTDARASSRVRVALAVPAGEGPRIVYPVALVKGHAGPTQRRFLDHLESPAAIQVFEQHGFVVRRGDTARR
jgi:molybdate transport system substrate-binding protein